MQVVLTWQDSLVGVDFYEIERTSDPSLSGAIIGTSPSGTKTFTDIAPLVPKSCYRVRARNSTMATPFTDGWAIVNIPTITGGPITNLQAQLIP